MARPKKQIDLALLRRLAERKVGITEIARQLHVSLDVVRSRMREEGLYDLGPRLRCVVAGHDLTKPGSRIYGGRCAACIKLRRRGKQRRKRKNPVLDIPILDIVAMRDQGHTLLQVAQHYRVSYSTLHERTRKAGILFRHANRKPLGEVLRARRVAATEPPTDDLTWEGYLQLVVEQESMPAWLKREDPAGQRLREVRQRYRQAESNTAAGASGVQATAVPRPVGTARGGDLSAEECA